MDKKQIITWIKRISFIVFLLVMIGVVYYIIKRYDVEGEKSLPFSIDKMFIVSTVDGKKNEDAENLWNISLAQVNDVYVYMSKNTDSKVTVKEITLDNFKVDNGPVKGNLILKRPTGDKNNLYTYSEQDYLNSNLTYVGAKVDDWKNLEISNAGGVMAFRFELANLGNYVSSEDVEINYNGTLLPKIGITNEDIKYDVSYDMTIKTSDNVKFRGNIKTSFPVGNIIEEGNSHTELTDFSGVIFKRVKE